MPYSGLVALPVTIAAAAVVAGGGAELRFSRVFPRTGQFLGALLEERLPGARIARESGREFLLRHLRHRDTRVLVVFGHEGWMLQYEDLVRRAEPPKKLVFHGPSKNPFLVLEGAGVAKAAQDAVRGALRHSGQASLAPARFYAVKPVAEEFVKRVLGELSARSRDGDGSLVVAHPSVVERLRQQLEDALAQGARLWQGGRILPQSDGPGTRVEPVVLTGVSHAMAIMSDETFAPALPIEEVADPDAALALAEDCRYALAASVYGEAPEIVRRLEKGHALVCASALPEDGYRFESGVGGYKASGWIWTRTKAGFSRSEGAHRPWVEEFSPLGSEEER